MNLDLLRSVAVLCVFFAHLPEVNHHLTDTTWHFGQMGVLIFFVHTSLVLMQSMERMRLEGRTLFTTFYLRRAFRIYPLSMFCVMCAFIAGVSPDIDHLARQWNLKELFANLTLTQNLFYKDSMVGGLWSLPLEVQMYVALPFLYILLRKRPLWWLLVLGVLSVPLALLQMRVSARLGVMTYVPCFLGGVLAWRLEHLYQKKLPGWLWPLAIVAICPVWFAASREYNVYYRWAFCWALGLAIPWFADIQWNWLKQAAKTVAQYSYGIYLSHAAIMMFCFEGLAGKSAVVRWATFVALCLTVPVILYHLIEAPMIGVGRKLTSRAAEPRTAPVARLVSIP